MDGLGVWLKLASSNRGAWRITDKTMSTAVTTIKAVNSAIMRPGVHLVRRGGLDLLYGLRLDDREQALGPHPFGDILGRRHRPGCHRGGGAVVGRVRGGGGRGRCGHGRGILGRGNRRPRQPEGEERPPRRPAPAQTRAAQEEAKGPDPPLSRPRPARPTTRPPRPWPRRCAATDARVSPTERTAGPRRRREKEESGQEVQGLPPLESRPAPARPARPSALAWASAERFNRCSGISAIVPQQPPGKAPGNSPAASRPTT